MGGPVWVGPEQLGDPLPLWGLAPMVARCPPGPPLWHCADQGGPLGPKETHRSAWALHSGLRVRDTVWARLEAGTLGCWDPRLGLTAGVRAWCRMTGTTQAWGGGGRCQASRAIPRAWGGPCRGVWGLPRSGWAQVQGMAPPCPLPSGCHGERGPGVQGDGIGVRAILSLRVVRWGPPVPSLLFTCPWEPSRRGLPLTHPSGQCGARGTLSGHGPASFSNSPV